jgi:hypothetical protein
MSAIDELKADNPGTSLTRLVKNAIFELADRLNKLEAFHRNEQEAIRVFCEEMRAQKGAVRDSLMVDPTAKPFRVTGPGRYKRLDGQIVELRERPDSKKANEYWPWYCDKAGTHYTDSGVPYHPLIAGPLLEAEPEAGSAGLRGYAGFDSCGSLKWKDSDPAYAFTVPGIKSVVDLSTITKDQLVQVTGNKGEGEA